MDIPQMTARAAQIAGLYDQLNTSRRGRTWTPTDFTLGFVGDLGSLAKHVMAAEGHRDAPAGGIDLEHHLADCLWSVLTIADRLDVDLETAFTTTMDHLEHEITATVNTSDTPAPTAGTMHTAG